MRDIEQLHSLQETMVAGDDGMTTMGRDKQTFKQAVIERERGRLRAFRKTVRVRTVYWESIAKYKTSTKL